jgi:hypothetical protein
MNHECSIVQDILPLYQENLVSGETKAFVQSHLETCQTCRSAWESMVQTEPVPADPTMPLKNLKKRLRRRNMLAIAVTVLVLAVLAGGLWFLSRPHLATYCEEYFTVTENEDGSVSVTVDGYISDLVSQNLSETGCVVQSFEQDVYGDDDFITQEGNAYEIVAKISPLAEMKIYLTGQVPHYELTFYPDEGEPPSVYYRLNTSGPGVSYVRLYGEP